MAQSYGELEKCSCPRCHESSTGHAVPVDGPSLWFFIHRTSGKQLQLGREVVAGSPMLPESQQPFIYSLEQ